VGRRHEVTGVLPVALDLGSLSSGASNGNTGTFINGRQLNSIELMLFERLLGNPIQSCRAWLDGRTGNYGLEGRSVPLGRLVAATTNGNGSRGSWSPGDGISNPAMTCTKSDNCFYLTASA
jgi:hypothetical protein